MISELDQDTTVGSGSVSSVVFIRMVVVCSILLFVVFSRCFVTMMVCIVMKWVFMSSSVMMSSVDACGCFLSLGCVCVLLVCVVGVMDVFFV